MPLCESCNSELKEIDRKPISDPGKPKKQKVRFICQNPQCGVFNVFKDLDEAENRKHPN